MDQNGNMGMTTPEKASGKNYTYVIYMKYKNGDYEATDAETRTRNTKLIVTGKGSVDLVFVLQAKEYVAE